MVHEVFGRPAEILLVEDNLGDARLIEEALHEGEINHRLTLVCDGFEAVEFLYRQGVFGRAPRPDLILLDLGLPKLDGRELLERIKLDQYLGQIPIIILTASQAHEDYLRGELLHVDCYLTKPVDVRKFICVVRQLKKTCLLKMLLSVPC